MFSKLLHKNVTLFDISKLITTITMTNFNDFSKIPKELVYHGEPNKYSKEQMMGFMHENQILRQNLKESTQKYKDLENRNKELENQLNQDSAIPFMQQTPSINSRIVELSKNLRDKCAELEKYKTKYSKLVTQFEELNKNKTNNEESKPRANDELVIKKLQKKLRGATNKILEYENVHNRLNEELEKAKKLIKEQTCGDIDNYRETQAKIISNLQEKNRKLKEKLKVFEEHSQKIVTNSEKPKIAVLENELTDLKTQNQSLKLKNGSLKARCKMLEVQQQEFKVKLQQNDEKCLNEHLNVIGNLSKALSDAENTKKSSIKDKDLEIKQLKTQIQDVTDQVQNYKKLVQNLKDQHQSEAKNTATLLDSQKEKLKLLELIKQQNVKLDKERNSLDKCQQLFRIQQQKNVKLEAAIAKSEVVDSVRSRHSYTSNFKKNTETDLKNKLELAEETIKSLQDRLQLEQSERKRDFQEFSKILLTEK